MSLFFYRCDLSMIDYCIDCSKLNIQHTNAVLSLQNHSAFGEEYTITLNHHLSFFQKSYIKAESISMGLPFAGRGLRVAYCVHSQRSELSLRIKKNQFAGKYWCMSIAPRSAVWSRNFFLSRRGEGRDRAHSASKSTGRESFERHLSRLLAGVWTVLRVVRKR